MSTLATLVADSADLTPVLQASGVQQYQTFLSRYAGELLVLVAEHIDIIAVSMLLAIPIGITLGVLITFNETAATVVLWLAGVAMTVPSIALFGLLIPVFGIGEPPVIVSLVVYSQLPLVRNTYVGLNGVDDAVTQAGRGLGMTQVERLRQIQVPMALPVIMTGLRNAVVIIIGVAAIGAFVGAGGLGDFIFQGIRERNVPMIVVTTVVLVLLTLAFDYLFAISEQLFRLRNGEQIDQARPTRALWKILS
ncbi:ABC transporter permease [Haloarcula salina]|uniref:ABC transporter permease n=1 Tax=Haloarcula salina TaxID=1429914 RepID=A0AA41KDH4_9EURY|nr:ABC transporter permease [Haloarcula salina]MBV0903535.1 ABC transporter permease [Haloarcula salina]